jgi:hypothetical protein
LNPRTPCEVSGFQDRCTRPLCEPSRCCPGQQPERIIQHMRLQSKPASEAMPGGLGQACALARRVGLENRCGVKPTESSNLSPSAQIERKKAPEQQKRCQGPSSCHPAVSGTVRSSTGVCGKWAGTFWRAVSMRCPRCPRRTLRRSGAGQRRYVRPARPLELWAHPR